MAGIDSAKPCESSSWILRRGDSQVDQNEKDTRKVETGYMCIVTDSQRIYRCTIYLSSNRWEILQAVQAIQIPDSRFFKVFKTMHKNYLVSDCSIFDKHMNVEVMKKQTYILQTSSGRPSSPHRSCWLYHRPRYVIWFR